IEKIQINGTIGLNQNYIKDRLLVGIKKPFNQKTLLNNLRLLQLNPLFEQISAEITAGSTPESSILVVNVKENDPVSVTFNIDNRRSSSVGKIQRNITVNNNNFLGFGDRMDLSYTNTDGSHSINSSYQIPFNATNGTFNLEGGLTFSNVIEPPFDRLDITGNSWYIRAKVEQPLILTPTEEFSLGLAFSRQESQTTLLGINFPLSRSADENGETRISKFIFSQNLIIRSAEDIFALSSSFNFGVDIFNATVNEKNPDSRFFSWRTQTQYVRNLGENTLLLLRGDLQLTPEPLISGFEQFGLGGLSSVRGYTQDTLLADNGLFLSAEAKIPVLKMNKGAGLLQIAPFIDFGIGWNHLDQEKLNNNILLGIGLGLECKLGNNFNMRLDWGNPIFEAEKSNPVTFSVSYKVF
ncbi:MAG TPA: ShlB/FhaC/HecB family hemolysin secretion/activation protein, partial [Allocoleopsis sp.]